MTHTSINANAISFVTDTKWCSALSKGQQLRVYADVKERVVPRGGFVYKHGSRVDYWSGILDGLVKLSVVSPSGRTSTFTGLAPGAWFGEDQVLRSRQWSFDATAMSETRLVLIPRSTFEWLLNVSPVFNRFIIGQLSERLAQSMSIVEAQRLESADACVAHCLAWLFNPVLYPGVRLRLPLTQEEIGYLSGVSRQRVNEALQTLQAARLLNVEYGGIEVIDLMGLQNFHG